MDTFLILGGRSVDGFFFYIKQKRQQISTYLSPKSKNGLPWRIGWQCSWFEKERKGINKKYKVKTTCALAYVWIHHKTLSINEVRNIWSCGTQFIWKSK